MNITLIANNKKVGLNTQPFKLLQDIDLSGLQADITISETGLDGGLYLNSRFKTRDIDIQGMINGYNQTEDFLNKQKQLLYQIVNPKNELIIQIENNKEIYYMKGYPVSFPTFKNDAANKNKIFQTFLIQLVCADPYLYSDEKFVSFSTVIPTFSFPMTFNEVKMGDLQFSYVKSIYNNGIAESPLEITLTALEDVLNPYLLNVNTQKKILINTTLHKGSQIYINTGRKKEISLIENGQKTTLYFALDLDSEFLQLEQGDNLLRYGADNGEEYLTIQLHYQERLGGL